MNRTLLQLKNPPQQILSQSKQIFIKAYQHLRIVHNKFEQELTKKSKSRDINDVCVDIEKNKKKQKQKYEDHEKQEILTKILSLEQIQQLIIVDLMIGCENVDFQQIGRFVMKMHLQNVEIVKWVVSHFGHVSPDVHVTKGNGEDPIAAYQRHSRLKQKEERQKQSYYYRMKQSSKFAVKGLNRELCLIQNGIEQQKNDHQQQINMILKKRQKVDRIEASGNQQLLQQAVQIISHQSQLFQKLACQNKQILNNSCSTLNLKPYAKLKGEIDELMKQKVNLANQKLRHTIDRFLGKNNGETENKFKSKVNNYGVQACIGKVVDERYLLEQGRKQDKIKELSASLNFQKIKTENLEKLMKQKTLYFEQKLLKARFDKNKETQITILKKSISELTSLRNVKLEQAENTPEYQPFHEVIQQIELEKENENKRTINALHKKKMVLCKKEQHKYQSSLKRIQFHLQDNQLTQSLSVDKNQLHRRLCLDLCEKQVEYVHEPGTLEKGYQDAYFQEYRTVVKKRLKFCSQVCECSSLSNVERQRNTSLLTIKNMKSVMHSKSQSRTPTNKKPIQATQREIKFKLLKQSRYHKQKRMKSHQVVIIQPNQEKVCSKIGQQAKISMKRINLKKSSVDVKAKDTFEILNLDDEPYASKNKGKLKAMMNYLKRKRHNREGTPDFKKQNPQSQASTSIIERKVLLDLFLNEQNAMEAQLQLGISTSILIADRKTQKQLPVKSQAENCQDEQYFNELSTKIFNSLNQKRKKDKCHFYQIQYAIKHPFSVIKGTDMNKMQTREELTLQQIVSFVKFMTKVHKNCSERPCSHLKDFFTKIFIDI